MPQVFISHSSKDRELAGSLVDLLRSALNLPADSIRCTSVDGHKLGGGQETDRTLRTEIRECEAFLGLISAISIESAYVLFELGARWGAERHLLPLLAPGADAGLLRGPLSGINALNCSSAGELHQMVQELAALLGVPLEKPAVYQRRIEEILGFAARTTRPPPLPDNVGSGTESSPAVTSLAETEAYASAAIVIQKHCEHEWPDDFSMRAYCIEQQEKALAELKRGRPSDIPEDVFRRIRQKCAGEWLTDFGMRQYCEEEQVKAYRKLHGEKKAR